VLVDNPEIKWIWPEDWTPDGKKIIAGVQRIDGTAQIALVSTADGAMSVLKSLEWRGFMRMALSPSGDYLAYDLRGADTNTRDVFVLKIDGTREIAAVTHRSNDVLVGWSPDGTRLLFTSERTGSTGLWSIGFSEGRIDGVPVLVRADTGRMPTISLTSSGALYMTTTWGSEGSEIKLARFDFEKGAFASALDDLDQGDGATAIDPRWSRDGKFLAYTVRRGSRQGSDFALRIRSMETGAIIKELRPSLSNFGFIWTPQDDGFFAAGEDFKGQQGLYRIDAATGGVTPFILPEAGESVFLPIFDRSTPNPDKFYYRRLVGQESVLVERALPSGTEREVARGIQIGISVNRQKTYSRRTNGNQEGIIVERDLKSGTEREIFRHKNLTNFVAATARPGMFADSGRFIAVVTEPASKTVIWLSVPLDGGEPRELTRATAPEHLAQFTVSPDGSTVIAKKTGDPNKSALLRLPLDGSGSTTVQLRGMNLLNLPGGPIGFSIHPDGKQVAFVANRGAAGTPYEVWVLENFLPRSSTR
jgi:Tol biopolymer transport system component